MTEVKHYPPKYCPKCGGTNISSVPCWEHSQWLADPSNPDWEPFHGTTYDTWCNDCKTCFDISPGEEMDVYWYDEYPEELPDGGNREYTDVLLRRSYEENENIERCGKCGNFHSGTRKVRGKPYFNVEIFCKLDKNREVRYYRPCVFVPSKFTVGIEQ